MGRGTDPDHDVVVVGGGTAGAAAAIVTASSGLRVCVLEAEDEFQVDGTECRRQRPGESLHPGAATLFEALGIASAVAEASTLRHAGHWVAQGDDALRFIPFGADGDGHRWLGFQIRRRTLEQILLRRAEEVGAVLERGCRAMDVLQGYDGRVSGVLTDRGPRLARWVFDASGGRHWLTRRLGAKATRISKPLVARFGWNNKGKPEPEYSHSARAEPVLRIGPRGWMWTAPLGDGHAAWVDVAFDAGGRRRGVTLPTSGLRDPLGGADVTWRRAPRVSGPGFVVIGDAGAVLDPAASRGVLRALMTGCVAAQCVVDALACRIREEDLMTRYARWHDDWFARDAAALAELYSGAGFQARRIIVPSLSPPRANAVHVVSSETRP